MVHDGKSAPPPTLSLFYCVPLVWAVHDSLQDESISPHQDRERERKRGKVEETGEERVAESSPIRFFVVIT